MTDTEDFATWLTETKQNYSEVAEREISRSESAALEDADETDHESIGLFHSFARALNEQTFGLILGGDKDDFDFITGGGISDPAEASGEFANRAPYIVVDIQRAASFLGFNFLFTALSDNTEGKTTASRQLF